MNLLISNNQKIAVSLLFQPILLNKIKLKMKFLKIAMMTLALGAMSLATTACGGHSHADDTEQQGKEYTSAYICPMHCEGSGSEEPGKCPVCGMDYVANEDMKTDDHDHSGHSHDGHDHDGHSHEGHNH